MNILDLVIVVAAIAYAFGGYRSGAVIGLFSLVGFFGGAVAGGQVARPLGSHVAEGRAQVPVAIVCVLVFATVGQLVAVWIGSRVRDMVVRGAIRPLDSAIGAVLGVVSVLLVAWMIAVPVASSPYPRLASEASQSSIVRAVDDTVPDSFRNVYSSLRRFFDQSGFPPVFGDLPSTSVTPVPPPAALTPALAATATQARRSIFKIFGQAPQCNRTIEGTGFVYSRHRILTNAHVVAGARSVVIDVGSGQTLPAEVVLYDPRRDVAVLQVPDLDAPVLRFAAAAAATGTSALVLGYPENGGYDVRPARVRQKGDVSGRDIYNDATVTRSIYSVRSLVRSGNSGGPLVSTAGQVYGMVFARALDSSDTGFVLANDEIATDADRGRSSTAPVNTQKCTSE